MNELTITLHSGNGEHLYEQIYEYIREEIMEGKLTAGEKLPSTRLLAQFLQISRSTVDQAYGQLASEGYIEAVPYKGYYVCRIEELFHMQEEIRESEKEPGGEQTANYDFSPHGIDMTHFPFATWKKISKDVFVQSGQDLFKTGDRQGDLEFRKTICRYLHGARGVICEPAQIVVGAGNDYLLLLLSKILEDKRAVAMERVTYKRAYYAFEKAGFEMKALDYDAFGMDVGQLEASGAGTAYIMPSHQFPTGIVMPIGRRMELLNWAMGQEGRYLIEDDYDSEFRYKGKPIPALLSSDHNGRVIYMGTFSKSIAPAIRVSFMVLPKQLLSAYEQTCGFLSCTVSRIDQAILNSFLAGGHYERYLNKMRKVYKAKHEILLEELEPFGKTFEICGENAGLHIVLSSREAIDAGQYKRKAYEHGIAVQSLEDYSILQTTNPKDMGKLLLGYGNLSQEQIRQGIAKLKEIWG